jgi:hypothetical protein
MPEEFDVKSLEFYTRQEASRQLVTRVLLITAVIMMLFVNMFQSERNYEAILVNVNQARLEAVALEEAHEARLAGMKEQLRAVETALGACETGTPELFASR